MSRHLIGLFVLGVLFQLSCQAAVEQSHMTFSLVRGSVGFVPENQNGEMVDAPFTVLAFTSSQGQVSLVLSDGAGDYTAVLQPGRYCVSAYDVKTGDRALVDAKQLTCVDVVPGKDVRLDVMLDRRK